MRMTISGDIRLIRRNILKPNGNGMVEADYGELHKVLDEIEAKEKYYKALVKELVDTFYGTNFCETDFCECKCTDICINAGTCYLIAKAKEVTK